MVFVVIDGLDASGKDTQAVSLGDWLNMKRKTVCLRIHPSGDNAFGVETKRFLYLEGKSAHFMSALFYMLDVLRSILLYYWRKYDYIIFVRYLMGTAYLPAPLHKIAYRFFALTVPAPDFMFFLDVRPEEAYQRILLTRSKYEMFESLDKLRKIRVQALSLALSHGWKIIDSEMPLEAVQREIRSLF